MVANVRLSSLQDLIDHSGRIHRGWSLKTDVWWRGQVSGGADGEPWCLTPRIYRGDRSRKLKEHELIRRFQLQAPSRFRKCPEDIVDWLFLMQHYGLPTRLLDWSRSALVGLYFAVRKSGHEAEDGVVWALHPGKLNECTLQDCDYAPCDQVALPFENPSRIFFEDAAAPREEKEQDRVVAVACVEAEYRMLIQQAMFTVHCSRKPLEEFDGATGFLEKFIVPSELKPILRGSLLNLGIHEAYLFPDLDHLSHFLDGFEFNDP